MEKQSHYIRYRIQKKRAPNRYIHPHPFSVKINRWELLKLIIKELIYYKGNSKVVKSRPCVYGVFSGSFGGFMPKQRLCVGCLRCTTQYPKIATILKNGKMEQLGDCYFTSKMVDTVTKEAENGDVPVRGQGYRGKFGGAGWDGIWTDMSEIVRPTRDGIYGREFISTEINIGGAFSNIRFGTQGEILDIPPKNISLPVPFLFDPPAASLQDGNSCEIMRLASEDMQTFAALPLSLIKKYSLKGPSIIPVIPSAEKDIPKLDFIPRLIEIEGWNEGCYKKIASAYKESIIALRCPFETDLLSCYRRGVRVFHLTADYHGRGKSGKFVIELIREAHRIFADAGCRDEVTLLGSGGIITAEHLPKAMLLGLDGVFLDTPLLVALQGELQTLTLPKSLDAAWGVQRLKNLCAAWHDQLFEVLGAMGLREVRRLRGEIGRAIFQKAMEDEAFKDIKGYE